MKKITDIAANLDHALVEIENIYDLLTLYDEHIEQELSGVQDDKPWTVTVMLRRKNLGLALLRAVEDKTILVKDSLTDAHQRLLKAIAEGREEDDAM